MGGVDEGTVEQLAGELAVVARGDWRNPSSLRFHSLPELEEMLVREYGDETTLRARVDQLHELLERLVAVVRTEEQQSPQPVLRSEADAAEALWQLSDEWREPRRTLEQRRLWICERWSRQDGSGKLKSTKSFADRREPELRLRMARRLIEMAEDAPVTGTEQGRGRQRAPTWPVEPHPAKGQEVVLLLASPSMRNGPGSELIRLVREFEPYWRVTRPMIYAVDGAFREIQRAGLLTDYPNRRSSPATDLVRLPAGIEGGLVHATELVVAASELRHDETCVIYLLDSRDPASLYPETAALKRECLLSRTPYLTSYRGAARWLTLEWACRKSDRRRTPKTPPLILNREQALEIKGITDDPDPMIALAAHDRHKLSMLRFVDQFGEMLTTEYERRYATEATGTLLNGGTIGDIDRDFGFYEMQGETRENLAREIELHQREWSRRDPDPHEVGGDDWAELLTHGRRGGVVQLARKVLDGDCTAVAFFQDAETPREHDMDIEVLDRAAQMTTSDCLVLYDDRSAFRWAANRVHCRKESQLCNPLTLVDAYRHHYGVELVLAHEPFDEPPKRQTPHQSGARNPWERVVETATSHVLGAILSAVRRRREHYQPARVGFTWGGVMQDIVGGKNGDSRMTRALDRRRAIDGDVSRDDAIRSADLRLVPAVGLVGSRAPDVEAQSIVARAASILGGEALTHPEFAFQFGDSHDDPVQSTSIRDEWQELDVLVCNCDTVRSAPGKRLVGLPDGLYEEVKRAAGVFGTIYLEAVGKHVEEASYGSYRQTGISFNQVQQLARHDDSEVILVAGALESRQRPAWAALTAGLVSTLVTDPLFAWQLLCKDIDGTWERYRDEPDRATR